MNTLLIVWLTIHNGVATASVYSQNMPSLSTCEEVAAIMIKNPDVQLYQCIEGYSLPVVKQP